MKRFVFALVLSLSASAFAKVELNDIVVGFDRAERDFVFPLKATSGYGELYIDRFNVTLSANCAGHITVEKKAVWCTPRGIESKKFAFATFGRQQAESDSSWVAVFLNWDTRRVTLKKAPDVSLEAYKYVLDIHE